MPEIWKQPVKGVSYDASILGLNGLERMQRSIAGEFDPPPLYHLLGLKPTEASLGHSTFTMPATGWLQSPAGVFLGGVLALVADAPLGSAIITALGPGQILATSDLSMNFLQPATVASEVLIAKARLVHAGRTLGLSEVLIEDAGGRLLAQGSCRCFIRNVPYPPWHDLPGRRDEETSEVEPFERPFEGYVIPIEELAAMSGIELAQAYAGGKYAPPPISMLTGIHPVEIEPGRSKWVLPASGWMMSPAGTVYGGAIAFLADASLLGAVQSVAPAGAGYATLDFKVHFLRPAFPDGQDLVAEARLLHQGKKLLVSSTEIKNSEGKLVAVATGSALMLEGRMARLAQPVIVEDEASDE